MKRSFKKMALIGALAGVLVIGGVSAVALANGNAYENFKAAAIKTMKIENMTTKADITISQDGNTIATINTTSQQDGDNHYSLSNVQAGGEAMEVEMSGGDDAGITRIGDKYYSFEDDYEGHDMYDDASSSHEDLAEALADLLVGDLKAHFTQSGDTVTVNLEGAQVPELMNLAVSAMLEERGYSRTHASTGEFSAMQEAFESVSIVKDAMVSNIHMEAGIGDGLLSSGKMSITINGKDAAGATHELVMTCNYTIDDIGSTKTQTIDTTGKEVIKQGWDY